MNFIFKKPLLVSEEIKALLLENKDTVKVLSADTKYIKLSFDKRVKSNVFDVIVRLSFLLREEHAYRDIILYNSLEIDAGNFLRDHEKYIGTKIETDGSFKCDAEDNLYACETCKMSEYCQILFFGNTEDCGLNNLKNGVKTLLDTGKYNELVEYARFEVRRKKRKFEKLSLDEMGDVSNLKNIEEQLEHFFEENVRYNPKQISTILTLMVDRLRFEMEEKLDDSN